MKKQNVYERKMKIPSEVFGFFFFFSFFLIVPLQEERMSCLFSLSERGLWNLLLCEPLNYKHSRRKAVSCRSSGPWIAAGSICDLAFTRRQRVRADCACVCVRTCVPPGPQSPPGFSGGWAGEIQCFCLWSARTLAVNT